MLEHFFGPLYHVCTQLLGRMDCLHDAFRFIEFCNVGNYITLVQSDRRHDLEFTSPALKQDGDNLETMCSTFFNYSRLNSLNNLAQGRG